MRSTLGIVLAGLAARAEVGVGGLEEAVQVLEDAHARGGHTSYRFALEDGKILAQVEQAPPESAGGDGYGEAARWRTLVELIS